MRTAGVAVSSLARCNVGDRKAFPEGLAVVLALKTKHARSPIRVR
ncbi:MAG: hypothetical protein ACLP1X_19340 [Polyangiaceae bacterium]|jgi:hypothetical protein